MNPHSVIYDYFYSLLISFVVSKGLDVVLTGLRFFIHHFTKKMQNVFIVLILIAFVRTEPQLDIPGVQQQHPTEAPRQNGLKVVVLPNSYANENIRSDQPKSEANTPYDQDRSQRYGKKICEKRLNKNRVKFCIFRSTL